MTTTTNSLGNTPPTVCPVCTGPCTLPGEGPTGQIGGLCTVCGWDYLVAADDAADGGDPMSATTSAPACVEQVGPLGCTNWCELSEHEHAPQWHDGALRVDHEHVLRVDGVAVVAELVQRATDEAVSR